eukprot:9422290-Alexandrium_andersonii.AAC.1
MSASLVGSEMCIRDRSGGAVAPPEKPLAPEAPARGVRRGGSPPGEAARAGCLLYTSDAADDM